MPDLLHLPMALPAIDRDYLQRDNPDLFDELWENPLTRVLPVFDGRVLILDDSVQPATNHMLRLFTVDEVPSAQLRAYLGKTLAAQSQDLAVYLEPAGTPVILAVLSQNSADQIEPNRENWRELRRSGRGLAARDANIYAQALALANFHASHRHCPSCGQPTVIQQGGWSRRCFADDKQVFPRTDPAIIVAVTDQDERILLGSQGVWEANRFSVLAGFVEAGESLTAAVEREVFEESGIRVHDVHYLGSQAWPFPNSLMVGFSARLDPNQAQDLRPDGEEIEQVRWFTRTEVLEGHRDGSLILPGPITIARSLIEHWLGEHLDGAS